MVIFDCLLIHPQSLSVASGMATSPERRKPKKQTRNADQSIMLSKSVGLWMYFP